MFDAMQAAAATLQVQLQRFDAPDPAQYEAVFAQMVARRQEAVAITEEATFIAQAQRLAALAQQQRLPTVGNKEFAQAGGLIGYGANREAIFRRAGLMADKLLRGARPADLPVEQPTEFELVLNARTAQAVGVVLPGPLRLRADSVIE
jgi:putative ABC transport system substrate-binding protein